MSSSKDTTGQTQEHIHCGELYTALLCVCVCVCFVKENEGT